MAAALKDFSRDILVNLDTNNKFEYLKNQILCNS